MGGLQGLLFDVEAAKSTPLALAVKACKVEPEQNVLRMCGEVQLCPLPFAHCKSRTVA
jgi:hypothetical protein